MNSRNNCWRDYYHELVFFIVNEIDLNMYVDNNVIRTLTWVKLIHLMFPQPWSLTNKTFSFSFHFYENDMHLRTFELTQFSDDCVILYIMYSEKYNVFSFLSGVYVFVSWHCVSCSKLKRAVYKIFYSYSINL